MDELKALLEQYFVVKETERDLYYSIRDKQKDFKEFISKLGFQLIVRSDFIKLEKLPGRPEPFMGIPDFKYVEEYAFFMLLLTFLEDKNKDEQFLLSYVTEFISNHYPQKVDWLVARNRRMLVNVMRFAMENRLMVLRDGEGDRFASDSSSQALYDSTGLSRYFTRNFPLGIFDCKNYQDLEAVALSQADGDKAAARRNRVYRRLLLCPVVYNEGSEDEDYGYIKNFKNNLADDFKKYLGWTLQVHKNGALLVPEEGDRIGAHFPNREGISDAALLFNRQLRRRLDEGTLHLQANEQIILSGEGFLELVEALRQQKSSGFTQGLRALTTEAMADELADFMESFMMAKRTEDGIIIYPLAGKIVGDYPGDY